MGVLVKSLPRVDRGLRRSSRLKCRRVIRAGVERQCRRADGRGSHWGGRYPKVALIRRRIACLLRGQRLQQNWLRRAGSRSGQYPPRCRRWHCAHCANTGSCRWSLHARLRWLPLPRCRPGTCKSYTRRDRCARGEPACSRQHLRAGGPRGGPNGRGLSRFGDVQCETPQRRAWLASPHRVGTTWQRYRGHCAPVPSRHG